MAELVIRRGLDEPDTSEKFVPHKPARPEKSMGGRRFELVSEYQPSGDQPTAIAELTASGRKCCSASPAAARPSRWPR
jgi:excinuclease ABC subunit B